MSADTIWRAIQAFANMAHPPATPYVIGAASVQDYNDALLRDNQSKAKLEYESGQVIIVEFPSGCHEGATWETGRQIMDAAGDSLMPCGAETIASSIVGRSSMEADGSWRKNGDPPSSDSSSGSEDSPGAASPIPEPGELVLVLEVGDDQTLNQLHARAGRWLTETSAREVILIDISQDQRTLRAEIWRRGQNNPVEVVDFSNAVAIGTHTLHVSVLNLFNNQPQDVPVALRGLPNNSITIDLYRVKRAIRGRY